MTWLKAHTVEGYLVLAALWAGCLAYNVWQQTQGEERIFPIVCFGVAFVCSAATFVLLFRIRKKSGS
ncbi:hypothetical protein [Glaciibacter flavus]|uniref:hypothetical protein n=1 Tax=Orlajensenia flava TaxID=2565934 RepID=UPI003AFF8C00